MTKFCYCILADIKRNFRKFVSELNNIQIMRYRLIFFLVLAAVLSACSLGGGKNDSQILFRYCAYPYVTEYKGMYYCTMQTNKVDSVMLWAASDLRRIGETDGKVVLTSAMTGLKHFWSPELHRINGKWYIYYEGDDGNTDSHQMYCIENPSENPLEGKWTQHGPILTNDEWNFGIHPTSVVVGGRQYLLWSGWEKRRIEAETQCIFIAEMKNPWTLKSPRVLLSRPDYEWERQWITVDGLRSAYPIFVNENPEAFLSPDGRKVVVAYSASGIWTMYNMLGMLYADAHSDLLNPRSWKKMSEPQFVADSTSNICGASNISVVMSPDKKTTYMMYETKDKNVGTVARDIRLKEITWDVNSLPVFGKP